MIRVLQVLGTVGLGGAESRVMDIYRHLDREKIQFDFLVTRGTSKYYDKEIEEMGGNIYYLPPFRIYNYIEYKKACEHFFGAHKGEYAAVHGHMTSTAAIYLPIAKKYGVPLTIAHARSAGVDPGIKGKITRIMRTNLYKRCDRMFTCSDEAGQSVFGDKGVEKGIVFMPNAIDTSDFIFNPIERRRIREEYKLGDKIVIGHVGSFRYAKNHEWVLMVFKAYLELFRDNNEKAESPVLMLLGDGELKADIENMASELGIAEKVIFTGNKSPVSPFYQAFDGLLFPSHYEGMPGTVVEAQAAGLPCLISDKITKQVGITELVTYMSLGETAEAWAKKLDEMVTRYNNSRTDVVTKDGQSLCDTLYDVAKQVDFYTDFYNN